MIIDDFDNDGNIDLFVSTWDTAVEPKLLINRGDGTFDDRTKSAGVEGLFGGLNMVQADFDNDGDVDVFVLRGAWLGKNGRHPNSLLRNDGGRFVDVTFEAGMGEVHYPSQSAAWADYDNDGDVDLYVGNEHAQGLEAPGQLFRNNGDGTFTDVAALAGVTNGRWAKGVSWGDYDNDGDADLYVSNLGQPNRLYRNEGNGRFRDVATSVGVTRPLRSFPTWFWDYDNDGNLDLFVAAYTIHIGHLARSYRGEDPGVELAHLYRGDGRGGFVDVARKVGLRRPTAPMGSNFGDLDRDGFLDLYLGTGDPLIRNLMPNAMFRNQAGRAFADITTAGGFGHLQKGHGVVFADFDNDGDTDVFEQMGGAMRGDRFYDVLYENPGVRGHWIGVKLVGKRSNRSGIGARIKVVAGKQTFFRWVNSGGSFGGNPLRQEIGIGEATTIERIEVLWPATGRTQVLTDVPPDRHVTIEEPE